jgi:processive 1,2-diacylglycerol beta-glucosyltransferase
MARSDRILILHCPAGGGHRAAAGAIAEAAASRGLDGEVANALELSPPWFARAYVGAHLQSTEHAPHLYGYAYAALDQRNALAELRGALDRALGARLLEFVRDRAPRAIVATHFFPLAALGHARRRGRLEVPLVCAVTDYGAHAFWAERGVDRFCAPAGRAPRDLVRHRVSPGAIVSTGIPVRAAFGAIPPLRIDPGEPLRVLVTSGGFGIGPMADVLRSFAGIPSVRLVVICGDNPARVAEAHRAAAEARVAAEVVGFEPDMPRRMAEAHVLVGKPGGLTVSEAMAAGRPMILVGACPGQEVLNQRWIVERGAAVVVEPGQAGRLLARLRGDGALVDLARAARALGAPRAAQRVIDVTLSAAGAPAGLHGKRKGALRRPSSIVAVA